MNSYNVFKLMLNILKVMGSYFYLYTYGDLVQKSFHVPINHGNFLRDFLDLQVNYKLIKNEIKVN
jgi:hypothetical protein